MKKLLLLSLCVTLAFSSCSKKKDDSPSTGPNTITANVGGTVMNFNTAAIALSESGQGTYALVLTGATGTGSDAHAIELGVASKNPITKGTYTYNSSTSPDAVSFPSVSYIQSASTNNPVSFTTDLTGPYATTVTITSLSSTNVQGTFSGVLTSDQDDGSTKSVTSGTFNVAVKTQQ